jgi:hypothetical protein
MSNSLLRVLLIEDNRGYARVFEEHLQDSGQEVVLQWEQRLRTIFGKRATSHRTFWL